MRRYAAGSVRLRRNHPASRTGCGDEFTPGGPRPAGTDPLPEADPLAGIGCRRGPDHQSGPTVPAVVACTEPLPRRLRVGRWALDWPMSVGAGHAVYPRSELRQLQPVRRTAGRDVALEPAVAALEQPPSAGGVAAQGVGQPDAQLGQPLPEVVLSLGGVLPAGLEDLEGRERPALVQQLDCEPHRV